MTQPGRTPLAPREMLRVMDAAQVIHERQAVLEEHEAFDREATIREIQLMYEELGDLVGTRPIERALDQYLSQRYAFPPAHPGLRRNLALLYIRRGWISRRVLVPATAVAALVWGGMEAVELARQRAFTGEVDGFRREVAGLVATSGTARDQLDALIATDLPPDLPSVDLEAVSADIGEAGRLLAAADEILGRLGVAAASDLDRAALENLRAEAQRASGQIDLARNEIAGADERMQRHARLLTYGPDVDRLHAAVVAAAIEDAALERAAALQATAERQLSARDAEGLGETVRVYEELHALLAAESRIVVTGGVWRVSNDDSRIRNYYLLVQALGSDGQPVPFPIRNEETGVTRPVSAWGERVPQETYDRVAADRQDNGIIDDEEFGFKRRGYITAERRYPDVGQITEW